MTIILYENGYHCVSESACLCQQKENRCGFA
jgi:hypothetical protein